MTARKEKLLAALLGSPSIAKAAPKAGVSERTARRWLADPDFRQALEAARAELVEAAMSRLHGLLAEATEALRRNLKAGSPSVEVRAAQAILDLTVRASEPQAGRLEWNEQMIRAVCEARGYDAERVLAAYRGQEGAQPRRERVVEGRLVIDGEDDGAGREASCDPRGA